MMIQKIMQSIIAIKNIHIFIVEYFGFLKNRDLIYLLRNGTKIQVRAGSTDSAEVIIINSDVEYPRKYFPKTDAPLILDIGANIGAFSIYISRYLSSRSPTIHAIEPSSHNYQYLINNIELNGMKNIIPHQLAISSISRLAQLDISSDYDAYSLLHTPPSPNIKTEQVNVQTLEVFCSKNNINHIDLLKIDIEGGEYQLFRQSHEFIQKNVSQIFIELYPSGQNNIDTFIRDFVINNYKIIDRIMNRTLVLIKQTNR